MSSVIWDALTAEKLSYSTNFWALCPPGDYSALRDKWLGDAAHASIGMQADQQAA